MKAANKTADTNKETQQKEKKKPWDIPEHIREASGQGKARELEVINAECTEGI